MIFKNTAGQGVYLFAYDKSTGLAKTGDTANITATIGKDGAAPAPTATTNPTESGGGVYWMPLSQGETNCNTFAVAAASSTSNVIVTPVIGYTTGAFAWSNLDAAITGVPAAVWAATTRTLSSFGTLVADVWTNATRTLTAFAFSVTVGDKTGYSLTAAYDKAKTAGDATIANQATILAAIPPAPDNAAIALIKGQTDKLNFAGTDVKATLDGELVALTTAYDAAKSANAIAPDNATIAAINERTMNLPDEPAGTNDIPVPPTEAAIADKVLARNLAGGSDGGRTVRDALRTFRNKVGMETQGQNTTLTVYKEDDTTPAWTAKVDSDPSAKPITGVDPD